MITINAQDKDDIVYEADLEYSAATATYSGRCMFGEQCVGFTVDSDRQMALLSAAIIKVLGDERGKEMLRHLTTDSMGMGIIVYFPSVQADGWTDLDDDEDWDEDDDY